jgi:hypothetical protein
MNKYLVSGAAVVVASAIAVNPVAASPSLPDVRQATVQLTAATNPVLENPLLLWQNTFTNSVTGIGAVGASLWNNPFPILNQIGENQLGYLKTAIGAKAAPGQRRGTGFVGAAEGVQRTITNLPVRLQAAAEFIAQGQFSEAFVELNTWALVAMENVVQPLLPLLAIPKAMFDAAGRVYESLVTRGNVWALAKGVMSPPITVVFAMLNVADTIYTSVKEGNLKDAFTALVNAPALMTGAFFNGYRPFFGHDEEGNPIYSPENFPGLFSANGTLDSLFVKLPQTIAAALKKPVAAAPAVGPTTFTLDVPGATPADVTPASATSGVDAEGTPETDPAGAVAEDGDDTEVGTGDEVISEPEEAPAVVDDAVDAVDAADDAEVTTEAETDNQTDNQTDDTDTETKTKGRSGAKDNGAGAADDGDGGAGAASAESKSGSESD